LDPRVIKKRARQLGQLSAAKKQAYLATFQGKVMPVLVEASRDKHTGRFKGLSRNYLSVLVEGDGGMVNEEVLVKVSGLEGEALTGQLAGKHSLGKNPFKRVLPQPPFLNFELGCQ
jgi:tRNA A37 methylthiotransferase MiaB